MPRQTVTFTKNNDLWLAEQAEGFEYSSKSDVLNDLIRQERRRQEQREWLIGELEKGFASGTSRVKSSEALFSEIKQSVLAEDGKSG